MGMPVYVSPLKYSLKSFDQRISRGIIDANGKLLPGQADVEFTPPTLEELCRSLKFEEDESRIDMSITYIFRRKKPPQPTTIATRLSAPVLRTLCLRYANDPTGSKAEMASRLVSTLSERMIDRFVDCCAS